MEEGRGYSNVVREGPSEGTPGLRPLGQGRWTFCRKTKEGKCKGPEAVVAWLLKQR